VIDLILSHLKMVHGSIYGITQEESETLTGKNYFHRFAANLKRLVQRWESCTQCCEMRIGFRLAYERSDEELTEFLRDTCGRVLPFGSTHRYANWGNSMTGNLPGDAEYLASRKNRDTCILLALGVQVYWDGRVSACSCCDYDVCEELYLGDLSKQSLLGVFNSERNRAIWLQHETGSLPEICRTCTFHQPVSGFTKEHPIVNKITDFIGG
jgi:radical SAM protein with 4Fe4S-binding SPASM domain